MGVQRDGRKRRCPVRDASLQGMDIKEYAICGGGFPIKLKSGEMVGVILASNLPHEKDHQFIVDGLTDYINSLA